MAHIHLQNACAKIPVYDPAALRFFRGASLKLATTVGAKQSVSNGIVTIDAVKDISLHIKEGQRVALIGHNGAGKTSLLRLIAGIYPKDSGVVDVLGSCYFYGGTDATNPDGTGYENIQLALSLQKISPHLHKQMIADIEDFTELGDYLNLPTRTYSAGMSARLTFALATLQSPEILLIDEGIGAGDHKFKEKVENRIKGFTNKAKIIICASHSDDFLKQLCDIGVVMRQGTNEFTGKIDDALEFYHSTI